MTDTWVNATPAMLESLERFTYGVDTEAEASLKTNRFSLSRADFKFFRNDFFPKNIAKRDKNNSFFFFFVL